MNLLIINSHDTGVFTGVYGGGGISPNMEEFAKDCTVFDNAYCVSPTCSPSRGAMLTGRYPTENGLIGLAHRGFTIKDKSQHLASYLSSCGYETVLAGIQHENVFWADPRPAMALGYQKVVTNYNCVVKNEDDYMQFDRSNAENAAEYLKTRDKSKPFYLSYGTFSTHRGYPHIPEDEDFSDVVLPRGMDDSDINKKDTAMLNLSLKYFDDSFQIILDALKESGEFDNTLILITTDHGLANPFEKCNLECGGTHVMFMLRNPSHQEMNGKRLGALVSHLDVFPSVCDILGEEKPSWLQGESFAGLFECQGEINDYTFHELNFHTSYEPARCVRSKDYVYIEYLHPFDNYNLSNIDESPQKKVLLDSGALASKKAMIRLYDKKADPNEINNVFGKEEYASVAKEYAKILENWRKSRGDRLLTVQDYLPSYQVNKMTCRYPSIKSEEDIEK